MFMPFTEKPNRLTQGREPITVGSMQAQAADGILHLAIRVADCAQREAAGQ